MSYVGGHLRVLIDTEKKKITNFVEGKKRNITTMLVLRHTTRGF